MEKEIKRCLYDVCWKGTCGNDVKEGNVYCDQHEKLKCEGGNKATRDCHDFNGSFVCGAPLCDDSSCNKCSNHKRH